ncbi:MAG: hypothetical protein VX252_04035 [Myxococcota bacterium]|nr:hypothetical protein [Myxococcota bacterium]
MAVGFLFFILASAVVIGTLFLLAEGRRTVSLCAGYLGIGLALSGIMLLGGGIFAAILLFVLSMSTGLALLLYGLRAQGRGEESLDLPQPARLTGKLLGSAAVLAGVLLLSAFLPVAESSEASGAVTANPALLGIVLFRDLGLVLSALGLLFTALSVGSLALVLGRPSE